MSNQPPNPPNLSELIIGKPSKPANRETLAEERHFGIRIARDGTWYYQGTPIRRLPLVKLFSSVIRRDGEDRYWLITPAEQGIIDVDDAPFVAVEVNAEGTGRNIVSDYSQWGFKHSSVTTRWQFISKSETSTNSFSSS